MKTHGYVAIVGAGPGDPELLTVKALKHLQRADVILADALVSDEILALARADARILDVGKTGRGPSTQQEVIHRILLEEAGRGNYVVRMKGGDPFVFGRGSEEAQVLARAGVPFEVVPGLSSALCGPASFNIPVTHRGVARSFTVVTGTAIGDDDLDARWADLARAGGTLVFLMALRPMRRIADRLVQAGLSAATPAAVIQSASRANARLVDGTLDDIADAAELAQIASPALLIVGDVVRVGAELRAATALLGHSFADQRIAV